MLVYLHGFETEIVAGIARLMFFAAGGCWKSGDLADCSLD